MAILDNAKAIVKLKMKASRTWPAGLSYFSRREERVRRKELVEIVFFKLLVGGPAFGKVWLSTWIKDESPSIQPPQTYQLSPTQRRPRESLKGSLVTTSRGARLEDRKYATSTSRQRPSPHLSPQEKIISV
jgi:hypothetical protein